MYFKVATPAITNIGNEMVIASHTSSSAKNRRITPHNINQIGKPYYNLDLRYNKKTDKTTLTESLPVSNRRQAPKKVVRKLAADIVA